MEFFYMSNSDAIKVSPVFKSLDEKIQQEIVKLFPALDNFETDDLKIVESSTLLYVAEIHFSCEKGENAPAKFKALDKVLEGLSWRREECGDTIIASMGARERSIIRVPKPPC